MVNPITWVSRLILLALLFVGGCGLDSILFGELTRGEHVEVPGAGESTVSGVAPGFGGAKVQFFTATGNALSALDVTADSSGSFSVTVSGAASFSNLIVDVQHQDGLAWGVIPQLPAKNSVFDADPHLKLSQMHLLMGELGTQSTLATLLLLAEARANNQSLSAVSPASVLGALDLIEEQLLAGNESFEALQSLVNQLSASPDGMRLFPDEGADFATLEGFNEALQAALEFVEFEACYPSSKIRLVLIADMRFGMLDRNCTLIDRFRWATDVPGKRVFVTGGIHKDTPRCKTHAPPCLDDSVVDEASLLLGNWVPNQVLMYDDGTHGDTEAGDGLWTLALEFPWFETTAEQSAVRIGYKYTYGNPGQGWTSTEEWPGNKRVLSLRDVNGDRVITRQDLFGDETTNKDKANLLSPAKGGCGTVIFPNETPQKEGCTNDSVESRVDTDSDCVLDQWPPPGVSGPITIECEQ